MSNSSPITEILVGIGLTDNESKVYLAMLSLGPATILAISKASGIKRTTVYNVLENLNTKGLSRINVNGFKKQYVAEHPSKLESILIARKSELESIYPQLEALYNLEGSESLIKYYEGAESVKNVYLDLIDNLEHNEEFLVAGDPERWEAVNASFAKDFIKRRNKHTLRIRMLLTNSDLSRQYKKFEQNFKEHIKLLPADSKLDTNLVITSNKVLIQQMTSPIAVTLIENKSILRMHTEFFNVMWKAFDT